MEPVDPRQRFSGAAAGYARFRPSYPAALVDWIVAESSVRPGDRVADVRGVTDREGFDRALRSLFGAHAHDGAIEFPYRGVGLVFRVASRE